MPIDLKNNVPWSQITGQKNQINTALIFILILIYFFSYYCKKYSIDSTKIIYVDYIFALLYKALENRKYPRRPAGGVVVRVCHRDVCFLWVLRSTGSFSLWPLTVFRHSYAISITKRRDFSLNCLFVFFIAKKFKKVLGKETCSETLESTSTLEKEKFPQDYFPEVGPVVSIFVSHVLRSVQHPRWQRPHRRE